MIFPKASGLALALALMGSRALAQYSGWDEGQVNSTMCTWKLPRVAIVRDTIFLDGGSLLWFQGMETGEYTRNTELNTKGLVLALNLSTPFSLTQNLTSLFDTIPKASAADDEIVPNYIDGALLANDDRFFTYGGLAAKSAAYPDAGTHAALEYRAHPAGSSSSSDFSPGFSDEKLPDGLTRYLAYGASVSAPSEDKAWYFSGLRAPSGGVVYPSYSIPEAVPSNISDTLVSVAFEGGGGATWKNGTLAGPVRARAGASGVFVPVGKEGILVFVGGATFPEFAYASHKSANPAALESESEAFMRTIDVYDIASSTWFTQRTPRSSPTPPILALGCAVAQSAPDLSSFNIYHYGGYRATDQTSPFNDDVWILSLPSFTWVRALSGTAAHARAAHRCVSPYPDQMMVLGGFTPLVGTGTDCLMGGVVQVLNLTSVEWMEGYDPETYGEYGVPSAVQAEIGGGFSGGATVTEPEGGWDDDGLGDVFGEAYPTERIKKWYPYAAAESTERPEVDGEDGGDGKGGGSGGGGSRLPEWVPPTLGAVLGLIVVVICGVLFFFWRKRKVLRRASAVQSSAPEPEPKRVVSELP